MAHSAPIKIEWDLEQLAMMEKVIRANERHQAWQRAESPEVVEAVRDRIKSIANDPHIKDRYQMYAEVILEATLTELIGPKPEGDSHE